MTRVLLPAQIDPGRPARSSCLLELGGATMGTRWSARLYAAPSCAPALFERALSERLAQLMAQMSHWDPHSELGRFNRAVPGSWHGLSDDFFHVLAHALELARLSGGAFDPCAGALVNLWGFGPPGVAAGVPAAHAIERARAIGNWRDLELDPEGRRARQPGGLQLDLSGIAKGYAVDCLADVLERYGVHHYLVEVGGELRGAGAKDDGQPWWVALERVEGLAAQPEPPLLALHGLAVASSGDYLRYVEDDGQRYPHTIDPRSGWPIANGVALASVVGADCMLADAWATALTVLGMEAGARLADACGVAARLVRRDGSETISGAFAALLQ